MNGLYIKEIFNKLQDDESRMIFKHRLLFYLDGNYSHLLNMLDELDAFNPIMANKTMYGLASLTEFIRTYKKQTAPIIAYGAGKWAGFILAIIENKCSKASCLCDSNPELTGTEKYGYRIINPETLVKNYKNAYVVISTWYEAAPDVLETLLSLGFDRERIFWFPSSILGAEQYFGPDFVSPAANEIYVDAGSFDGDSIRGFIEFCEGTYKKIYAMEPDPANMKLMRKYIEDNRIKNINPVAKGAWSEKSILRFSHDLGGGSQISSEGTINVPVTTTPNP